MEDKNDHNLTASDSEMIARRLNNLLANYFLFYQNTRGFRWHIKGGKFDELHKNFDALYDNLRVKIDEIADRILAIGHMPEDIYSKYITLSLIPESKKIWEGDEAIANILESYATVIAMQTEILEKATSIKDEGTAALMSNFIEMQEQQVKMYTSLLNR